VLRRCALTPGARCGKVGPNGLAKSESAFRNQAKRISRIPPGQIAATIANENVASLGRIANDTIGTPPRVASVPTQPSPSAHRGTLLIYPTCPLRRIGQRGAGGFVRHCVGVRASSSVELWLEAGHGRQRKNRRLAPKRKMASKTNNGQTRNALGIAAIGGGFAHSRSYPRAFSRATRDGLLNRKLAKPREVSCDWVTYFRLMAVAASPNNHG
jgi:hypothetical protein